MISKRYIIEKKKVFGNDPWDIEIADGSTFEEMVKSDEMYIPHHVLEWKYTFEELNNMNRYNKVSPNELIWVKQSVHNANEFLHKDFFKKLKTDKETKKLLAKRCKERSIGNTYRKDNPSSTFGKKFKSYCEQNNVVLNYSTEYSWYCRHNHKCRWE